MYFLTADAHKNVENKRNKTGVFFKWKPTDIILFILSTLLGRGCNNRRQTLSKRLNLSSPRMFRESLTLKAVKIYVYHHLLTI